MPNWDEQREAFWSAIEAEPWNSVHKLVFSDWLDEVGDSATAFALRWMVGHKHYPAYRHQRRLIKRWAWFGPNGLRLANRYPEFVNSQLVLFNKQAVLPCNVYFAVCHGVTRYDLLARTLQRSVSLLADGLKQMMSELEIPS